ncbi:MAG: immune inhibitor A [bacterium]
MRGRLLPALLLPALLLPGLLPAGARAQAGGEVRPIRPLPPAGALSARPHLPPVVPRGIGAAGPLRSAREAPRYRAAAVGIPGPVLPDTLRVLVLRVAFQPDDDPRTTGDGTFDMRSLEAFRAEEGHDIDAAPHDADFIARHMRALHNYWHTASLGSFSVSAGIHPGAGAEPLVMPRPMAHYGFESPLGDLVTALETLAADAVAAAEAAPGALTWEAWDAFVIFHAGADWQGDRAGAGDTPADLPTAYVALGRPVPAGGGAVADFTLIPETASQDGEVTAINGVFAHEFGHQLGLPDLYDTVGGATAVGLFALMDSGDVTGGELEGRLVRGVLPALPSAWSRAWLGWTEPAAAPPGASVDLAPAGAREGIHAAAGPPQALRVEAAPGEAFLAEYRSADLDGDPAVGLYWEGGVIDGTAVEGPSGRVRTYEYDALLPGSGVLLWHLDEEVAGLPPLEGTTGDRLGANQLQGDRLRRFLDLEEADGAQQLGWVGGYLGEGGDYWGPESGALRFGPDTRPDTGTALGARTGLSLWVEEAGTLRLRVRVDPNPYVAASAPLPGADPDRTVPWMWATPSGGLRTAAVDAGGGLHLFDAGGGPAAGPNPVWSAGEPVHLSGTDGVLAAAGRDLWFLDPDGAPAARVPLGGAASAPAALLDEGAGVRAFVPLGADGVAAVAPSGVLAVWTPPEPAASLLVGSGTLKAVVGRREIRMLADPGAPDPLPLLHRSEDPIIDALMLEKGSSAELVVLTSSGRIALLGWMGTDPAIDGGSVSRRWEVRVDEPTGGLASARMPAGPSARPGEEVVTVAVPTSSGVRLFTSRGVPVSGWPPRVEGRAAAESPRPRGEMLLAGEAVLWVDGDGSLRVRDPFGGPAAGDRLQLPGTLAGRITLASREGVLAVAAAGGDSLRWLVPGTAGEGVWTGPGGGRSARRRIDAAFRPSPPAIPAARDFYVYPNPARRTARIRVEGLDGQMVVHAFTLEGTSLGEVARIRGAGSGPAEWEWDVSGLAPGVYFLVGEVRGREGPSFRLRAKMMVVR